MKNLQLVNIEAKNVIKWKACVLLMNTIFSLIFILSFIYAVFSGNIGSFSSGIITDSQKAVEISFSLLGTFCLWNGIHKVAENSKFLNIFARMVSPVLQILFKNISLTGKAMQAIIMNLSANLLGMGNAATPFGIKAVEELKKEEKSDFEATDNMIMLVVLNTASLSLIPTTVIALRTRAGSMFPEEIIPAVILSSLLSVLGGIAVVKLLWGTNKR